MTALTVPSSPSNSSAVETFWCVRSRCPHWERGWRRLTQGSFKSAFRSRTKTPPASSHKLAANPSPPREGEIIDFRNYGFFSTQVCDLQDNICLMQFHAPLPPLSRA